MTPSKGSIRSHFGGLHPPPLISIYRVTNTQAPLLSMAGKDILLTCLALFLLTIMTLILLTRSLFITPLFVILPTLCNSLWQKSKRLSFIFLKKKATGLDPYPLSTCFIKQEPVILSSAICLIGFYQLAQSHPSVKA